MQFHPNDLSELDDLTEEQLGFSALSEGLGFSKKRNQGAGTTSHEDDFDRDDEKTKMSSSGIGAVSAGMARPAPGFATGGKNNVTTVKSNAIASNVISAYGAGTAATSNTTAASIPTGVKSAINPLQVPAAPQSVRTSAFLVDVAIVLAPLSLAWFASFGSSSKVIFKENMASPLFLFSVLLGSYFLLSESFGGQSLGKMLFHLRVVEDDKYEKPTGLTQAIVRLFLLILGTALAGLGLLSSFRDTKKRPWHDIYSGTIVRRKN